MKYLPTLPSWLERRIPALDWLAHYQSKHLRSDALAGVIVATLLIPQAMAYALLAGLPPQVGLYASLLPLAVHALLGSSRNLSVGPSALLSLLIVTQVAALAQPGSPRYPDRLTGTKFLEQLGSERMFFTAVEAYEKLASPNPQKKRRIMNNEKHDAYPKFLAMIATSTVVMMLLMYLNTHALDHIFWSETRAYMAVLMAKK